MVNLSAVVRETSCCSNLSQSRKKKEQNEEKSSLSVHLVHPFISLIFSESFQQTIDLIVKRSDCVLRGYFSTGTLHPEPSSSSLSSKDESRSVTALFQTESNLTSQFMTTAPFSDIRL